MQNVHLQNRIITKTWSSDFKCRILSSNVEFFWINHTLEAILVIHHLPIFNHYTLKIFNYFISKYFFQVFFTSNTIHPHQKNQYGEEGKGKQRLRPIISFKRKFLFLRFLIHSWNNKKSLPPAGGASFE